MPSVTIKELHATTGEIVRRARTARAPLVVTDRGEPIAVIASAALVRRQRRARVLLPEFETMMSRPAGSDMIQDLNAVRGDR